MFLQILGKIFTILVVFILIHVGNFGIFYAIFIPSEHYSEQETFLLGTGMLIIGICSLIGATYIFIKYLCITPFMRFFAVIIFSTFGGLGIFYGSMMIFSNFRYIFSGLIFSLGVFWISLAVKMAIQVKNEHISKK